MVCLSIPLAKSLIKKDQEGDNNKKKPCPGYALWCKDQWNEIKKENLQADFKTVVTKDGDKKGKKKWTEAEMVLQAGNAWQRG
ncbi:hypothetical protein E2562_023639 [Oryza meyeriana var. granulata]|uniref:Uncharacterized protein n=1 Tax=Oryza meyeriana var. granulata TaxID=110450 RepID=A0A6G1BN79_9ORYZ|nr:hypothetical protein E2562_023639 [Oryza meyeriana var. granulata]